MESLFANMGGATKSGDSKRIVAKVASAPWYVRVALERGIDHAVVRKGRGTEGTKGRRPGGTEGEAGFTYGSDEMVAVGERVEVPLGKGNKKVAGIVTEVWEGEAEGTKGPKDEATKEGKEQGPVVPDTSLLPSVASSLRGSVPLTPSFAVKMILRRTGAALPESLVSLARWMASYYVCPLGMVMAAMMPAAVKKGVGVKVRLELDLVVVGIGVRVPGSGIPQREPEPRNPEPDSETSEPNPPKMTRSVRAAWDAVLALPVGVLPMPPTDLAVRIGIKTRGPLNTLVKLGLLRVVKRSVIAARTPDWQTMAGEGGSGSGFRGSGSGWPGGPRRSLPGEEEVDRGSGSELGGRVPDAEPGTRNPTPRHQLTHEQDRAVRGITASLGAFGVHLLFGVTGSGKTEVYLRVIEEALKQGKSALVLVPEIALTPQTSSRFQSRFERFGVAVLHSGLSGSQRTKQWSLAASGDAKVVVGARSAVFAPMPNLGVVVVDEEHDGSYKQDQLPRYHARDVAIKRAQLEGATVILGSATPSLESWSNAVGVGGNIREVSKTDGDPRQPHSCDAPHSCGAGFQPAGLVQAGSPHHKSNAVALDGECGERATHEEQKGRKYALWELRTRVAGALMPTVQIVDLLREGRERASGESPSTQGPSGRVAPWRGVHLIGPTLERAIGRTITSGGQVILLLNRRGYASCIVCPNPKCAWSMQCGECDSMLVFHRRGGSGGVGASNERARSGGSGGGNSGTTGVSGYVRCHHCLAEQMVPRQCPSCGTGLRLVGGGTQRVEEEIAWKFGVLLGGNINSAPSGPGVSPGRAQQWTGRPARTSSAPPGPLERKDGGPSVLPGMLRLDSDTMLSAKDYFSALSRFASGEVRLLLGTQMIAKGLDFPNVQLVGVLSADTALWLPDFRAAERTFQLVSQVAGRAGRGGSGGKQGLVIVQTLAPDASPIKLAASHDYVRFATEELAVRRAAGLPPAARMARIVVRDENPHKAEAAANELAGLLAVEIKAGRGGVRLDGPAPCAIARIAGQTRYEIVLTAPARAMIQDVLGTLRARGELTSDDHTAIDIDPVALM